MKKQKGIATLDMVLYGMAAIALLLGLMALVPKVNYAMDKQKLLSDMSEIKRAALEWKGQRSNYATLAGIGVLCARDHLNDNICGPSDDGVATNPFGGNYTITPSANVSLVDISATGIEARRVADLADAVAPSTRDACTDATGCGSINAAGSVITATM